jgi:hypothetical protein
MEKEPRNIRLLLVIMLIIGILLLVFVINSSSKQLEIIHYYNLLHETEDSIVHATAVLYGNIIFLMISIILIFLFGIGIFFARKWAWIGALMVGFYEVYANIAGFVTKVVNYTIVGYTEFPFFDLLNLIINIIIIILAFIMIYLLLKSDVKQFLKISI